MIRLCRRVEERFVFIMPLRDEVVGVPGPVLDLVMVSLLRINTVNIMVTA
jgi:hypothetical protein